MYQGTAHRLQPDAGRTAVHPSGRSGLYSSVGPPSGLLRRRGYRGPPRLIWPRHSLTM